MTDALEVIKMICADLCFTYLLTYLAVRSVSVVEFSGCYIRVIYIIGPGNGSPMATNVVLILGVVVIGFSIP